MKSIKRQKSFPAALSSLFRGGQTKESTAAMKAADDWPSPPLPAATGQIRGRLSIDNNKSHFYSNDNDGDIYTSFYNSNKNSNSSESTALATSNNPTLMMIGSTSAKRQQNELKDISYKKQSVSQDSQMDEEEDNIAKLIQLINDCDNLAISNSLAAVKQSASVSTANVQYAAEVNNSTKKPAAITSSSGSLNHLKPPLAVDRAVSSNSATSTINNGSSSFSINSMSPYPPSRPHHDDTSSGLTLFNR